MANYVAAARTNYFRVTDEQKWQGFRQGWHSEYGLQADTQKETFLTRGNTTKRTERT